jgi:hypothetical protein
MLDTLDGCWISLHTDDPGLNGANEVSGNGYGRQAENLGPASSGNKQNIADINFSNMPACVVQYYGTWDASSGGNFLWGCALIEPKTVNVNDTVRFEAGKLRFTLY